MIGKNGSLANIWNLIRHIAPTDATVLITGESGAGKEVVADEIFQNSARKNEPCIKINCASIPADLLESELFGYEKGAFSGANPNGKKGLFEQANHGTLMLDEIGDMPMELQVKLLRAIQQQEITRVGGSHPIKLDIRFIALTNSNLKEKIVNGTFRQDLYYRLNVIPIYVPPLRERLQDLEALCNTFIRKYTEKYHCAFAFTNQQLNLLKTYHWPGNIRELENIIEYVILCSAGEGTIEESETEDKDWINNWKQYFKQFYVDDILIIPSWEEVKPEDRDKMIIHIDPGTAFGTGMHETTQLCIRQLKKYVTKDTELLDVGTGSGILSIIALKLGARHAVGTDLDPCAVPAVEENKEVNGIPVEAFDMMIGNIIDDKEVQDRVGYEKYDIVTANILADVLVPLTPVIVHQMKPGAVYITSGILDVKEEVVKEAVVAAGLEVVEVTHQGEWVSVTARKPM